MALYKIATPEWKTGGCTNNRHITTPLGWLGLRKECWGWVVTGTNENRAWNDLARFKGESAESEAEAFAIEFYEKQVLKFLTPVE